MQEDISYETVEAEIDFKIDDIKPEPEMQMAELEADMEIEMEMEVVEIEETVDEQPTEEETTEPDSEATEEPAVEVEDSTEQEDIQQEKTEEPEKPVKEPSAKEKAATKIVKKMGDKARYDESNQMKTLIVMQILGNTKTFFDTQATIQDTNVNEYLNKVIDDPYGGLFIAEQGQIMEDIVNAQY